MVSLTNRQKYIHTYTQMVLFQASHKLGQARRKMPRVFPTQLWPEISQSIYLRSQCVHAFMHTQLSCSCMFFSTFSMQPSSKTHTWWDARGLPPLVRNCCSLHAKHSREKQKMEQWKLGSYILYRFLLHLLQITRPNFAAYTSNMELAAWIHMLPPTLNALSCSSVYSWLPCLKFISQARCARKCVRAEHGMGSALLRQFRITGIL